jgi:hypothetical protein
MSDSFHSFNVDQVDTTAYPARMGMVVTHYNSTLGKNQVLIYVKNNAATSWAAGDVIIQEDDGTTELAYGTGILRTATTAVPTATVLGCARGAVAQNEGAWILHDGEGSVKVYSAGATAAGDPIGTSGTGAAAGGSEVVAATAESFGRLVSEHTAGTGTETLTARLFCSKFRGAGQLV